MVDVFKNGRESLWDATLLNKPVPQLIRILVSDWAQRKMFVPNRRPASIALLSRSSYTTKPPFFEEVAPINFLLYICKENGTHTIHRKKLSL